MTRTRRVGSTLLVVACVVVGVGVTALALWLIGWGVDSLAYWTAWRRGLYSEYGTRVSYLYSPAFAEAIWPIARFSWTFFSIAWATLVAVALLWLVWPLSLRWRFALFVLFAPEIVVGNVWTFYAVVVVLGFRYPQVWAFPLLTKLTTGQGVLWYATRREWRKLGLVFVATGAIALVSFAIAPHYWTDWLDFLWTYRGSDHRQPPLAFRLPLACALTIVAALYDRPRWLPVSVALAAPVFGIENLVLLAALPRIPQRLASSERVEECFASKVGALS